MENNVLWLFFTRIVAVPLNERMTTQEITAWDGGTIFNYETQQLEPGGYGGWVKEIKRQPTYYRYVDKNWYGEPLRQRQGQVTIINPTDLDYNV